MRRTASKTILVVGEGDDENALSHHVRAIYTARGCGTSVKIRNAYGRGPENIVRVAMKAEGSFDKRAALLDTDVPWDGKVIALARRHRIEMIGSEPCLDGLLLRILGEPVPANSNACKTALGRIFPRGISDRRTLEMRLTREVLEVARTRIEQLDLFLRLFEGR